MLLIVNWHHLNVFFSSLHPLSQNGLQVHLSAPARTTAVARHYWVRTKKRSPFVTPPAVPCRSPCCALTLTLTLRVPLGGGQEDEIQDGQEYEIQEDDVQGDGASNIASNRMAAVTHFGLETYMKG